MNRSRVFYHPWIPKIVVRQSLTGDKAKHFAFIFHIVLSDGTVELRKEENERTRRISDPPPSTRR